MTVSLRQLEYFVAVADEGSFTRASELLHVSRPGLSIRFWRWSESSGARSWSAYRGKCA
ncbi:LysR family transcriptional regulator [Amycolatopsis sp.]|uniref:LysR family transcriptional regulator n=1 Tax=Amycolatopsis sp. TaxID=37632 RepID=UPI00345ACE0C